VTGWDRYIVKFQAGSCKVLDSYWEVLSSNLGPKSDYFDWEFSPGIFWYGWLYQNRFLPNPFQFVTHLLSCYSILASTYSQLDGTGWSENQYRNLVSAFPWYFLSCKWR
jgi:hypothetical protein